MIQDDEFSVPVSAQDIGDALLFVLLEIARIWAVQGVQASEALEVVANNLLDAGQRFPEGGGRAILLATAKNLIQTETGLFDE